MITSSFATPIDIQIPTVVLKINNGLVFFEYSFDGGYVPFTKKELGTTEFLLSGVTVREIDGRLHISGNEIVYDTVIFDFAGNGETRSIDEFVEMFDVTYEKLEADNLIIKKPAKPAGIFGKALPERYEWTDDQTKVRSFPLRKQSSRNFNIDLNKIIFSDHSIRKVDIGLGL